MNSFERMLGILDFYTEERVSWTAEDLIACLGCSRATVYRYLKALSKSGLLSPKANGAYTLGPRVIELDRQIRLADPLLAAAKKPMEELNLRLGENVLLCSFYGEKVLCIDRIWTNAALSTSFRRGRPLPLFKGACGKVILAYLPAYQQRKLFNKFKPEIESDQFWKSWSEFAATLKEIRRAGYYFAEQELDEGMTGIAAPIFGYKGAVLGSLTLAAPLHRSPRSNLAERAAEVIETARAIDLAVVRERSHDQATFSACARRV